jgi:hypothetical protein
MSVSPPRWTTNTTVLFLEEDAKSITTTTFRSPLVKVLSIIIPFSVLLIVFMLPTTTHEVGSFWEVIAGIILGLWGVSEMLIPSYIDYPTLIGSLILILYAVIGVFVINFVAKDFIKRQQLRRAPPTVHPNPLEDIPNEGSIENLFVWAIRKLNEGIESTKIAEALFTRAQNERSVTYKKKLIEVGEKILKS